MKPGHQMGVGLQTGLEKSAFLGFHPLVGVVVPILIHPTHYILVAEFGNGNNQNLYATFLSYLSLIISRDG